MPTLKVTVKTEPDGCGVDTSWLGVLSKNGAPFDIPVPYSELPKNLRAQVPYGRTMYFTPMNSMESRQKWYQEHGDKPLESVYKAYTEVVGDMNTLLSYYRGEIDVVYVAVSVNIYGFEVGFSACGGIWVTHDSTYLKTMQQELIDEALEMAYTRLSKLRSLGDPRQLEREIHHVSG